MKLTECRSSMYIAKKEIGQTHISQVPEVEKIEKREAPYYKESESEREME